MGSDRRPNRLAFKGEASRHGGCFLMTGILGGYTRFGVFRWMRPMAL